MLSIDFLNNDYETTKTLHEQIEEAIAIDILTGVLKPNSQIVEDRLCSKYNISRTPLRQILQRLATKGFVNQIPNRGSFVFDFNEDVIEDYFILKTVLYPQCVKWAIQRITPEEFEILEETFYFMEFYTQANDMGKMEKINRGFEAIIYNASHNSEVEKNLLKYDFIIRYVHENISYPNNYLTTVLEEHRAIFNAFKEKNAEAGCEAAKIHSFRSMMRRK